MKSNFGKPLTKKEMKAVQGGKLPGCAAQGLNGEAYAEGCCAGLSECPGSTHKCEPPSDPCHGVA